jgi:hypothetical protein
MQEKNNYYEKNIVNIRLSVMINLCWIDIFAMLTASEWVDKCSTKINCKNKIQSLSTNFKMIT